MSDLVLSEQPRALAALSASEMGATQQQLTTWLTQKLQALGRELREQRENLRVAKAAKWRHSGWLNAVSKTKRTMIYYAKLKAAVAAGYVIVPNFDATTIAVRVDREKPRTTESSYLGTAVTEAQPTLPPHGKGRYVDDTQYHADLSYEENDPKNPGKMIKKPWFESRGYDEMDFPAMVVKPIVLDATQRAMALRIFDRIGIVGGRKKDPIVVGEILSPKIGYSQKRVTFFIAWWLDVQTL